ncbi:MAG: hypothetical protein KJO07_06965 [Deltaproteobacteria bacterium]|nr:hypothetical protein [Deltaproteobacteria bacterium]
MIRWVRTLAIGALILSLIGVGIFIGLFLVANSAWVPVEVPEWLEGLFGKREMEAWLPALLAGWLLSLISVLALFGWSMYYVWRRRQYEALVKKLEKELAGLRNLPFKDPAPLEDLDEEPDPELGEYLGADDDEIQGAAG